MNTLNLFTTKPGADTEDTMNTVSLRFFPLFRGAIPAILILTIFLASGPKAVAATKNFISGSGNWNVGGNWSPAGVPVTGDTALIDGGRTADLTDAQTVTGIHIGYVNTTGTNILNITSTGTLTQAAGETRIGYSANTRGIATVDGSWLGIGTFYVGSSGEGTLTVGSTGTVSSGGLTVGTAAASKGIMTINGNMTNTTATIGNSAGSIGVIAVGGLWANSGAVTIGSFGSGTVTINSTGKATTAALTVGNGSGSKGTLTISGSMLNTSSIVGSQAGSEGIVNVSGTWTNSNAITIGGSGTGALTVNNGGRATSTSTITIGSSAGGSGNASIFGNLSNGSNGFWVGASGSGALTVGNTGTVSTGALTLGNASGARSTLTINGSMLNTTAAIANSAGSRASVAVSGTWTNSSALTIGGSGVADVTVNSGGVINSVGTTILGSLAGSAGSVVVRGALNNTGGDLWIASQGTGTLTVGEQGSVSVNNGSGIVYLNINGSGVLNIGGAVTGGTPATAEGAGILKVTEVAGGGGAGTSILNFNHTGTGYYFTKTGNAAGAAIKISGSNTSVNVYAGETILNRDNYYGAGTTVTGSTARLVAGFTNSLGTGAVAVSNGGVLEVASGVTASNAVGLNGSTLLLSNGVAGGVVQFSGTGGSVSGAGTLSQGLTLTSGNTLAAGGAGVGTLTFGDALNLESGSITKFDINSFTAGGYDLLSGTGQSVTLGGTLDIRFQSEFDQSGSISIFAFQSFAGTFETINFTGLKDGFDASFDAASGVLTVVPEPSTCGLVALSLWGLIGMRRFSRSYAKL